VDNTGALAFRLDTSVSDAGRYIVTVEVNPGFYADTARNSSASAVFVLEPGLPVRSLEGIGPLIHVPDGIAFTDIIFLPIAKK
jgi:hypothetical protein